MKKLSIITVNYNNHLGLRETIESVINQTFTNYEYIIIDGGSTDNSINVIQEYSDKIDYWISEPDKGIYDAMNKGILKASGEYCNFMNSGDCFYQKNVLEKVFLSFYNEDIILGKYIKKGYSYGLGLTSPTISMLDLCKGSLNHQSAFIKKDLFINNLYDDTLRIVSDWKFFIDTLIFKNCSFRNIDIIITNYNTNGISATNREQLFSEKDKVLKEILPERIYVDYIRFAKGDSPILEITPILNQTHGFHKFIYKLVKLLVRTYTMIRNIFHNTNRKSTYF